VTILDLKEQGNDFKKFHKLAAKVATNDQFGYMICLYCGGQLAHVKDLKVQSVFKCTSCKRKQRLILHDSTSPMLNDGDNSDNSQVTSFPKELSDYF